MAITPSKMTQKITMNGNKYMVMDGGKGWGDLRWYVYDSKGNPGNWGKHGFGPTAEAAVQNLLKEKGREV